MLNRARLKVDQTAAAGKQLEVRGLAAAAAAAAAVVYA